LAQPNQNKNMRIIYLSFFTIVTFANIAFAENPYPENGFWEGILTVRRVIPEWKKTFTNTFKIIGINNDYGTIVGEYVNDYYKPPGSYFNGGVSAFFGYQINVGPNYAGRMGDPIVTYKVNKDGKMTSFKSIETYINSAQPVIWTFTLQLVWKKPLPQ
jgi:hypothetical protein